MFQETEPKDENFHSKPCGWTCTLTDGATTDFKYYGHNTIAVKRLKNDNNDVAHVTTGRPLAGDRPV